ncbi:pirin family protein [Nocardioides piscis]|uniref:Pirin family protein n=1 Tax=Nocardioides piscis TaxID=2714938 RepID=A0A6G7YDZ5_9ACTN|nr:pirin family protein [Nocardioides piscis]QIK74990.1 pirin family protein [Nocardioides piscis]
MTGAVYAGSARFTTLAPGRVTRHSFSFAEHYDPANLGFGPMVCHNDDVLEPAGGYPDHPHRDLEIVTWVLEGVLVHTDDAGRALALEPGDVQVMSAGSGIRHAEVADPSSGRTRFLQTWLRPDEPGLAPSWRVEGVEPGPGLTAVVGAGALPIGTEGARLDIARLSPGEHAQLPDAPLLHAFVAVGGGRLGGLELGAGDAVRLDDESSTAFEATAAGTELLVWSFSS